MNHSVTYTSARKNLKNILDNVCNNSQPILIKRKKGGNVVILSEEEFNSFDETAYLNASPKNKKHLHDSLKELEEGCVFETSLDEL
jgi:antitoxin YefM